MYEMFAGKLVIHSTDWRYCILSGNSSHFHPTEFWLTLKLCLFIWFTLCMILWNLCPLLDLTLRLTQTLHVLLWCQYLGFSPVPIWQMIESIHMIWSRTMPKNLSLSVSVVICKRHSSQDVSSSFQNCITSCSRHAIASAFSPAYTVLSWAALSCSWRT